MRGPYPSTRTVGDLKTRPQVLNTANLMSLDFLTTNKEIAESQ